MGTRDYVQVTYEPSTYHSCVSPGAKIEYETDIMDSESNDTASNTRYGLVAVDHFTKISEVTPINHRTPEELIIGLDKIFESMWGPK